MGAVAREAAKEMVKAVFRAVRRVSAVVFALSKPSVSAEGAPTAWGESPMMWEDANQTEASEILRSHLKG
jgi:hypothetical protein